MVLVIYLWLLADFILWPIPSEASTARLLSMNDNLWFRSLVILVFVMYLLVYLFPLFATLLRTIEQNTISAQFHHWLGVMMAIGGRLTTSIAARQLKSVHPQGLLRHGIFRFSRNPITLGTHLTLLGLVIIFPFWFMILGWIGGVFNLHFKIRLEERFMFKKFGDDYMIYHRSTPRYFII
jgi:protein-S-isoprenylcysteine O-methyltransferase Ste14